MRILIVDDHAVVRQGVKQILTDAFSTAEFGEASTAAEALSLVSKHAWDVVILDVGLPGRSGLDALKDILAIRADLPIVVLSMYGEEQYSIRAIRAGASAYLTKEAAAGELAGAIHKVMGGGKYITPAVAEILAADLSRNKSGPPHEDLSDREYQVLRMIGSGKSAKEIGLLLSLSIKTISTYRTRILEKLQLNSTAELIRYAMQHSIVE